MAENNTVPTKSTGDTHLATEVNEIASFQRSPSQSLGIWNPATAITIDGSGSFTDYTMASNLSITFAESGHNNGNGKLVLITSDGTKTLTFVKPSAYDLYLDDGLTNGNLLPLGTYLFGFIFEGGSIKIVHKAFSSTTSTLLIRLNAYWKFNETSGTRLDETTNNHDLVLFNSAIGSATGIISNAADILGTSTDVFSLQTASELAFSGAQDFTISTWIYIDDKSASHGYITKRDSVNNRRSYLINYGSGIDRISFTVSGDGTSGTTSQAVANNLGSPSINTWYHIVCYHDSVNDVIGIIVNNGTPDTTAHTQGVYNNTTDKFGVGFLAWESGSPTSEFNGRVDETGVWTKVLTAQEITDLYNSGSGLTYPFS
jgi:hypothetical protein